MTRNDSLLQAKNKLLLASANGEKNRLTARKNAIEDTLYNLQTAYLQEADGTGGSGKRGIEKLTRLKMVAFTSSSAQFSHELSELSSGIKTQDSIIASAKANLEEKRKAYEASVVANQGFLEKNKALSDLSDEESSVWWTSTMLSLLIILIEIDPFFLN
ncbi:MAG: hypothetical protein C4329_11350 [Chitinophagaceae bacterium]